MKKSPFSLEISDVFEKIKWADSSINQALQGRGPRVPDLPGRDAVVKPPREHPAKKGLSSSEGVARLLHDLASIELQAFELALRSLVEFPEAPGAFREELAHVARSEAQHLGLCLEALSETEHPWGTWPVHLALWQSVNAKDSLLDRVLIVHRYLEGSGLEAGAQLLSRLNGLGHHQAEKVLQRIHREEIDHVNFGSDWYRRLAHAEGKDPEVDFPQRLWFLRQRLPQRLERINRPLRQKAGFSEMEIDELIKVRESFLGLQNSARLKYL